MLALQPTIIAQRRQCLIIRQNGFLQENIFLIVICKQICKTANHKVAMMSNKIKIRVRSVLENKIQKRSKT